MERQDRGEPPPGTQEIAIAFLDRLLQCRLTLDLQPHAALRHRRLLAAVLLVDVEPETRGYSRRTLSRADLARRRLPS
ncbi:hypothetical protein [Methanopyrus sp.]